jgi:hypothetical protein
MSGATTTERRQNLKGLLNNDPENRFAEYLKTLPWGARGADSTCHGEQYPAALRGHSLGLPPATIKEMIRNAIFGAGCRVVDRDIQQSVDNAALHASPDEAHAGKGKTATPPAPVDPFIELRRISPEWANDPGEFLNAIFKPGERAGIANLGTMHQTPLKIWEHGQSQLPILQADGAWYLCNPVSGATIPNPRNDNKPTNRIGECVTNFRYAVLESDKLDFTACIEILKSIPLPIAAIYTSGGRSLHALIKVAAPDKLAWDRAVNPRKPVFEKLGFDPAALSAVRLTRLPFCFRGAAEQRLLYLAGHGVDHVCLTAPQPLPGDMWAAFDAWAAKRTGDAPTGTQAAAPVKIDPALMAEFEAARKAKDPVAFEAVREKINALVGGAEPVSDEDGKPKVAGFEAYRWDPSIEYEKREPRFVCADAVPLRDGNISVISGKSGQGKTAFRDGLIASTACNPGADCLGWQSSPRQGAVVMFDFEQDEGDFRDGCRRIWRRAGINPPDWFYAYRLRDKPLAERKVMVEMALMHAYLEQGGLWLACFDGGSDLVADVNDGKESPAAVTEWLEMTTRYECHLNVIIHTNEAMSAGRDARGHLGKEATRKAEAVFVLEKNDADFTTVNTTKNRKQGLKNFIYRWSDEAGMHVTAIEGEDPKARAEQDDLLELALQLARGDPLKTWTYKELHAAIMETQRVSVSTAERRIKALRAAKIIKTGVISGFYHLGELPSQAIRDAQASITKGL